MRPPVSLSLEQPKTLEPCMASLEDAIAAMLLQHLQPKLSDPKRWKPEPCLYKQTDEISTSKEQNVTRTPQTTTALKKAGIKLAKQRNSHMAILCIFNGQNNPDYFENSLYESVERASL